MRRLRGSGFARLVAGFAVPGPGCPPGGLVAVVVEGVAVAAEVVVVVAAAAVAVVVAVVVVAVVCCCCCPCVTNSGFAKVLEKERTENNCGW